MAEMVVGKKLARADKMPFFDYGYLESAIVYARNNDAGGCKLGVNNRHYEPLAGHYHTGAISSAPPRS